MGRMRRLGVALSFSMVLAGLSGCSFKPPTPQEVLAQGAAAWNQWRIEHPDTKPDLKGINLDKASLASVDLAGLRLTGAQLRETDLTGANLQETDLSNADLSGANLSGAVLTGTNLEGATLAGARLYGSRLADAKLNRADIGRADLTGADLSNATIDAVANWDTVTSFKDANIYRVVLAPSGFKDFALSKGARRDG